MGGGNALANRHGAARRDIEARSARRNTEAPPLEPGWHATSLGSLHTVVLPAAAASCAGAVAFVLLLHCACNTVQRCHKTAVPPCWRGDRIAIPKDGNRWV